MHFYVVVCIIDCGKRILNTLQEVAGMLIFIINATQQSFARCICLFRRLILNSQRNNA